jgi:hypothetical protein
VLAGACDQGAAALPIELAAPAREARLHDLRNAEAQGRLGDVAHGNALLARDALARARRMFAFQMRQQDRTTRLFAHSDGSRRWLPEHTGADLFPHLLIVANALRPKRQADVLAALAAERARCGVFPCVLSLDSGTPLETDSPWRVPRATEFAADGLLPPTERLGDGPWRDRLREVARVVVDEASASSPVGALPAGGAEGHGNLLQALARLGHRDRDERQLVMLERLLDAYLLHVAPAHGGLPAHDWDFARGVALDGRFRFRDHGAEILPGLAEAYLLERRLGRPSADRHRAPLAAMLAAALAVEREPDGLWRDEVDVTTGVTRGGAIDTWGYVLSAWAMLDIADREDRHRDTIAAMMAAAAGRRAYPWEGDHPDGSADAIESMLILLPFYPTAAGAAWVDDELPALFRWQQPDGSGGAGYLDGNLLRSALLYADWKGAGVTARPWRRDVAVGATTTAEGNGIVVALVANRPWKGRLVFDGPRHAMHWSFERNYPRRNSFPEWFPVYAARDYVVSDLRTGVSERVAGAALLAGLPVVVGSVRDVVHLRVTPALPDARR